LVGPVRIVGGGLKLAVEIGYWRRFTGNVIGQGRILRRPRPH